MGELQGIVRFTFHPGQVEEFKRLSARCLEIVRAKDDHAHADLPRVAH